MNHILMEIERDEGRLVTVLREPQEMAKHFIVIPGGNGCVLFIFPYAAVTDAHGAGRIGCHRPLTR
jgi:hypothetical protein